MVGHRAAKVLRAIRYFVWFDLVAVAVDRIATDFARVAPKKPSLAKTVLERSPISLPSSEGRWVGGERTKPQARGRERCWTSPPNVARAFRALGIQTTRSPIPSESKANSRRGGLARGKSALRSRSSDLRRRRGQPKRRHLFASESRLVYSPVRFSFSSQYGSTNPQFKSPYPLSRHDVGSTREYPAPRRLRPPKRTRS